MTLYDTIQHMRSITPTVKASLKSYLRSMPQDFYTRLPLVLLEGAKAGVANDRATLEAVAAAIAYKTPDLVIMCVMLAIAEPIAELAVESESTRN